MLLTCEHCFTMRVGKGLLQQKPMQGFYTRLATFTSDIIQSLSYKGWPMIVSKHIASSSFGRGILDHLGILWGVAPCWIWCTRFTSFYRRSCIVSWLCRWQTTEGCPGFKPCLNLPIQVNAESEKAGFEKEVAKAPLDTKRSLAPCTCQHNQCMQCK